VNENFIKLNYCYIKLPQYHNYLKTYYCSKVCVIDGKKLEHNKRKCRFSWPRNHCSRKAVH